MTMKWLQLYKSPEMKPHHQMQFSVIPGHLFFVGGMGEFLSLYSHCILSPTNKAKKFSISCIRKRKCSTLVNLQKLKQIWLICIEMLEITSHLTQQWHNVKKRSPLRKQASWVGSKVVHVPLAFFFIGSIWDTKQKKKQQLLFIDNKK